MKNLIPFFVFFLFLFSLSQNSFAQSATAGAKFINVSYDLPFPGILPDNPLYFLKALRDNVINYFITDKVKKADYDLLMADKRLVSAQYLVDKKNYQLALTTLSKAGNYFDKAIQLSAQAKMQGNNADAILSKLWLASQKHQMVIYQMAKKTNGETKYNLELLQVRAKNFQDTVDVIRSQ